MSRRPMAPPGAPTPVDPGLPLLGLTIGMDAPPPPKKPRTEEEKRVNERPEVLPPPPRSKLLLSRTTSRTYISISQKCRTTLKFKVNFKSASALDEEEQKGAEKAIASSVQALPVWKPNEYAMYMGGGTFDWTGDSVTATVTVLVFSSNLLATLLATLKGLDATSDELFIVIVDEEDKNKINISSKRPSTSTLAKTSSDGRQLPYSLLTTYQKLDDLRNPTAPTRS